MLSVTLSVSLIHLTLSLPCVSDTVNMQTLGTIGQLVDSDKELQHVQKDTSQYCVKLRLPKTGETDRGKLYFIVHFRGDGWNQ
jgi:hypothetical protein